MTKPVFPVFKPVFIDPLRDGQEQFDKQQQKIMTGVHYKTGIEKYDPTFKGKPIQERLVIEVDKIISAHLPGAVLIGTPTGVKTLKSASGKVIREYGGDWGRMKDLNRCTVVVSKAGDLKDAFIRVKEHFIGKNTSGLQYFDEKAIEAHSDPCGYSGYTVFVRTPGPTPSMKAEHARMGEIQINFPPMMYAKSLEEFRNTMGDQEAAMKTTFAPVPGGLGHKIYDAWKPLQKTPAAKPYEAASRLYYDYFRSSPTDLRLGQQAIEEVRKLGLPGVQLPPPLGVAPLQVPSWMAEARRVWTQRRS